MKKFPAIFAWDMWDKEPREAIGCQTNEETVSGTAILMLTAYDDENYILELLKAHATGYLFKKVHGAKNWCAKYGGHNLFRLPDYTLICSVHPVKGAYAPVYLRPMLA